MVTREDYLFAMNVTPLISPHFDMAYLGGRSFADYMGGFSAAEDYSDDDYSDSGSDSDDYNMGGRSTITTAKAARKNPWTRHVLSILKKCQRQGLDVTFRDVMMSEDAIRSYRKKQAASKAKRSGTKSRGKKKAGTKSRGKKKAGTKSRGKKKAGSKSRGKK